MKIKIYTKEKTYNFKTTNDIKYLNILKYAHREDGPALIWYFDNGNIELKVWFINGKKHREDGSAIIWYYKNGNIKSQSLYLNDKSYIKTEFNKEILKKKIQLI